MKIKIGHVSKLLFFDIRGFFEISGFENSTVDFTIKILLNSRVMFLKLYPFPYLSG